ncbi:M48 family metallopeptidase [uncultured Megasphaera sp.]|uniref:M48 family metallopeptidase n=1 Tax=uncultured Megasphaera sp. TaxID=165188 RepID=UPI002593C739|nr:SprT family zinc-dependent metalloprotease [uncultured Megasphaera sp.]
MTNYISETKYIPFLNQTIILERKPVKNINLRLYRDGHIHISASPHVPWEQIYAFLKKHEDTIKKNLIRLKNNNTISIALQDGCILLLNGKPHILHIKEGKRRSTIYKCQTTIHMELVNNTLQQRLALYHLLLRQEGNTLFTQSANRMFPLFYDYSLPFPKLKQRIMHARWGSCMPTKGLITLSTYLAIMPSPLVDQVMVHELCHLIHPNHSKHFYNIMTTIMPDWKERKKQLNNYLPWCI